MLLSPLGREALTRAAELLGDAPGSELAVAAALRREYPASLAAAAVAQHELRLAARGKFSRAMEMLFTRGGYEQSSSETIARHRAARFAGTRRIADLCCGIGGDLIALASAQGTTAPRPAATVLAVDRDEIHARLAIHNAGVYGEADRVRACVADVRDIALDGVDAVFIDPARRAGTRRFPAGVSRAAARLVPRPRRPGPRRLRQGRARPARRADPAGLGGRVHRRRPRPQGGRAVVAGVRDRPAARDDPAGRRHADPRAPGAPGGPAPGPIPLTSANQGSTCSTPAPRSPGRGSSRTSPGCSARGRSTRGSPS